MRTVARLLPWLLLACGGAQSSGEPRDPPRPLDEARAVELIGEVLAEYQVTGEAHRSVHLGTIDFEVDVVVAGKPVGLEYMTEHDRSVIGPSMGRRSRPGELRVIAVDQRGHGRIEVLFLEDRHYRYDPDPIEHEGGGPTIQEVEGRFRRDARDFLQHEKTAGHL